MGSRVSFNFFLEGYSPGQPSVHTTVNTPLFLDTRVPLEAVWMTSITLNGVGEDSPEVEFPARHPDSSGPPQTLSNTPLLLVALIDLSTPCNVLWYALYLYGKYSTGSDFSLTGYPPSCLATESMAHSWFDPLSCAMAPWMSRSLPPPECSVPESSNPSGALIENPLAKANLWSEPYLCSTAGHPPIFYTLRYTSSTTLYPREASLSTSLAIRSPWAILIEKYLLQFFHCPCRSRCTAPSTS